MLAARMISVFVSSCLSQLVADVRYFTTPPPPPPPPALLSWLRKHLTTVVFHHQQDLAISFLRVAVIKKGVKLASIILIISRSYCAKLKDCTHPTLRSNFSSPFSQNRMNWFSMFKINVSTRMFKILQNSEENKFMTFRFIWSEGSLPYNFQYFKYFG